MHMVAAQVLHFEARIADQGKQEAAGSGFQFAVFVDQFVGDVDA